MSIELFLYLADVVPNVAKLLQNAGLVGLLGAGFFVAVGSIEGNPVWRTTGAKGLGAVVCVFLLSALIPSKQTIYMIAGAGVAKQTLNSAVGQKVQKVVENQLDDFIKKSERK